jgi:hypothetical protein
LFSAESGVFELQPCQYFKKKIKNIMFFWRLHDANIKDKIKTSQTPLK